MLRKTCALLGSAALALGLILGVVLGAAPSAFAEEDPFAETCDDAELAEVDLPATCIDGEWITTDDGFGDDFMSAEDDFDKIFGVMLFIGLVGGGAALWWRVSTARGLARKAGMDENDAGTMAAFTNGGLEATYLASQLRADPLASAPATPSAPDATARLAELQRLRDAGAITPEEYDAQRRKIIESI